MGKRAFGIQWHITERCDQRCKHCYIFNGREHADCELSILDLEKIVNDFIETTNKMNKTPVITVTGGDPLLYPNVWDFFEILHNNNIKFAILGNPFHLTFDNAETLKELGCYNYQMSIDGLKETHDYLRKPGSFDETLAKVKLLNEVGIHTSIMTTISKINMNEIPRLVPILVNANVKNFGFARYCPNPNDASSMPTPQEYKEFLNKMWNVYMEYAKSETRFALKDHLWKLFLYEKGLYNTNFECDEILDGCHCGISHMTILSNGIVYACRRCESPVGKVPEQSLYEIFLSENLEKYRNFEKFEKCSKCELVRFCRGCPSVSKCTTGNFYAPDPQCWR